MLRNIALSACGALLALLATEMLMRLMPVSIGLRNQAVTDLDPVMRSTASADFTYSKDWNFRLLNRGRTNNFGFYSSRDYRTDLPSVALIGDSFVHAAAIPAGQHLSDQLARKLPQADVPAYDFGWAGGSMADYLTMARWVQSRFQPRAMAFVMMEKDIDESLLKIPGGNRFLLSDSGEVSEQRSNWTPNNSLAARMAQQLHLYHYLNVNVGLFRWIEGRDRTARNAKAGSGPGTAKRQALAGHFLDALERDIRLPRQSLVFLIDADRPSIYQGKPPQERDIDVLATLAERRGYPVVRLETPFRSYFHQHKLRVDLTPIDGHWNITGYDIAAAQLAPVLGQALQVTATAKAP